MTSPAQRSDQASTGDALFDLLDDLIPTERAKKNSLEVRALAVISSAGTLVTLLLGFAAIVTNRDDFEASPFGLACLVSAVTLFVAAAILSVYCNAPGGYLEFDATSLLSLTTADVWTADGAEARREIAQARLHALADWQRMNESKAKFLSWATIAECAAVGVTALAVSALLWTA